MTRYAIGRKSKFISDRSGFAFPYRERVMEWNGNVVHRSEYEVKHPQLTPQQEDDNKQLIVITNTGLGILGTKLDSFSATTSLGTVTVSTS